MNTKQTAAKVMVIRIVSVAVLMILLFLIGYAVGYLTASPADVGASAGTVAPLAHMDTDAPLRRPDLTEDTNSPLPPEDSGSDKTASPGDSDPADTTQIPAETSSPDTTDSSATEPTDDPTTDDSPRPVYPVTDRKLVVCVDPGHGYDDPGTVCPYIDGLYEKDINLKVALLLRDKLVDAGFEVIMTRWDDQIRAGMKKTNDLYLFNPYAREEFLRAQEVVDLFVSIHCNASEGDRLTGTEIYYYEHNNDMTPAYVQAVADGILSSLKRESYTRGYPYDDAYYVTKCTHIPSILVEMAYLSNEAETQLLLSDDFCDGMARGIADGICAFAQANLQ